MQSDNKIIYKLTAERTGKPEKMYKDLGNFVFAETSKMMKRPTSLIIKLKGVGSWHLRKKRMEIIVKDYPERDKERVREDYSNAVDYQQYLYKKEIYNNFVERLKEYDEYLSIKKQVREKRYETQVLLEPGEGEDIRHKSS
jgi:hypothetical protein